jgi:[glutamine synthetase] adenylyltransferase / [glutamine synthetase]-adenylyl-L-tyrosine phosphorylase
VTRYGVPQSLRGTPCRFAFVSVGKYGAREPNYHSDMSLLCLYESQGVTKPIGFGKRESLTNDEFFHQLAFKVTQGINRVSRVGRLFEAKPWLLIPSQVQSHAWKLTELEQYFRDSRVSPVKRLEFCSARSLYGEPQFQQEFELSWRRMLSEAIWSEHDTWDVLQLQEQWQSSASERNIKRSSGGTLEIEWTARILMLQQLNSQPYLLVPSTLECIDRLKDCGIVSAPDAQCLRQAYNFLREVESGLRLMNTAVRHELPSDPKELERLAYVMGSARGADIESQCIQHKANVQSITVRYMPKKPAK